MSINERKDKTGRIKEVELNLQENEAKALGECRAAVSGDAELDDLRDATLVRFLRTNSWDVEATIKQLKEYMAWRVEKKIDEVIKNPDFPSKTRIRTIIPYAYHNSDKQGRPIYIEKTGMIATAALADEKLCPMDHMIQSHIYGVEYLQLKMYETSLERGERVNGICTILDMNGLGFHHRQCLNTLKTCMEFDKKYYPEYVDKLYVINTPWVAPYLYQAVQLFLDEVTKSRIQIIANPNDFLLENIPASNLPAEYGGSCDGTACNFGGIGSDFIPTLKCCVDVLDSSSLQPATDNSGLDSQVVAYDFEKLICSPDGANEHNSTETFTWYFEVTDDMDIDFSVELLPLNGIREEDPEKRVLIQKIERLKVGKGSFKAPFPNAKLLFRWDNNFSYFNSKTIKYSLSCVVDESGQFDSLIAQQKQ